jgi:flagellar hook protein FlgE
MSFQTGLSGLNASSKSLDVIGNNIANANTVGMKSSRTEFADIVASSLGTGSTGNSAGIGVSVGAIAQQFTQGNINITGNSLDVAINGSGFFQVTKSNGSTAFTRDGQFKLDKDGNLKTNTGSYLMGYPTDKTGAATSITLQKLTLPTGAPIPANPTTTITAEFNLDARAKDATQAVAAGFTPTPLSAYGTSISVYDKQGVATNVSMYFHKVDATNPSTLPASYPDISTAAPPITNVAGQWDVYTDPKANVTSTPPDTPIGRIYFDSSGKVVWPLDSTTQKVSLTLPGSTIKSNNPNETTQLLDGAGAPVLDVNGNPIPALPDPITIDLSGVTQFGANFSVSNLSQDGYTAGEFTSLSIDGNGVISTSYSNGQNLKTGGMIALADFRNLQGLSPIGGGEYLESFKSGPVVLGQPGVGKYGELRAGAVEESNVDLTSELVNMMTAQRNYQANAQTIKTQDQIMTTLVNLR